LALNLRATTIPRPPAPCTEAGSGDSAFATTGVVGKVVDVPSKTKGVVVGDDPLSSPPLHAASKTAANPAKKSRRGIARRYNAKVCVQRTQARTVSDDGRP
jgi:hypothetical protein